MGCRVQFCIGGGCVPTTTHVSAWVEAFGYSYDANDPLLSTYRDLIAQSPVAHYNNAAWEALAEACMRTRALLFCNQSPGDAGSTNATAQQSNLLPALGVAQQGISVGLNSAAQSASQGATGIVGTIGKLAGPIGIGVSLVFSEILSAFEHHAQAVKAQANALSTLCPYFTEAVRKADYAVFNGQATPDEAIQFLQQVGMSLKSSVASLTKSCNAFCWYNGIVDLIVAVSPMFYQYAPQVSGSQSNENIPSDVGVVSNGVIGQAENAIENILPVQFRSGPIAIGIMLLAVFLFIRAIGRK